MIFYTKGYKYQLNQTYVASLPRSIGAGHEVSTQFIDLVGNILTIREGYAWDGPSGPTIDTKTFMQAALIHDALYQLIRMKKLGAGYRQPADEILRDGCITDGMWKIRANWIYRAVRKFGGGSAIPGNIKEVFTAPV